MDGQLFIKGYKIDHDKLSKTYGNRKDDPENTRFLSIWKKFPLPYLYLATGKEPGGRGSLVLVMVDGYNKEEVEEKPIPNTSSVYKGFYFRHLAEIQLTRCVQ